MAPLVWISALLVAAEAPAPSTPAPAASTPTAISGYERVVVPVPTVALDAKTDGQADLRVSVGILTEIAAEWNITPRVSLKSSTSGGLGTLFSWTGGEGDTTPQPWSIGAVVALTNLPTFVREPGIDAAKEEAYARCKLYCRVPVAESSKAFCDKRDEEIQFLRGLWYEGTASEMKAEAFCKAERDRAAQIDSDQRAGKITPYAARTRRAALLGECLKHCDDESDADEAQYCRLPGFEGRPTEAPARRFNDALFCPEGRALLESYRQRPAVRARISQNPPFTLKVGGQVGRSDFKNLSPSPSGVPGQLVIDDGRRTPWSVGGSFAWLLDGGHTPTLEGVVAYGSSFKAADDAARWCTPAGAVVDEGQTADAETCRELPLGAPTEKRALRTALFVGYLDQVASTWRISAGVDMRWPKSGDAEVALAVPVWVSFAGSISKYLGIAQITPSATSIAGTDKKRHWRFAVAIALLGQPTLVSPEFDQL